MRGAGTLFVTTAMMIAGGAPSIAYAQTDPVLADDAAQQGDIIVTANKREERIQDVALSISAVSGDELVRRQAQDVQDIARRVPGLNFQQGGNIAGSGQRLVLRGLNTGGNGATVGSVLDDVPLNFSGPVAGDRAVDLSPQDLQRVEVLRGPQGTLYGANALGGLIKYVSNAPDLDEISGSVDAGLFTLAHANKIGGSIRGHVNVPVSNGVAAIRVNGFYDNSPGFIDNDLGNQRNTNDFERYGGRFSLLAQASESLSFRATAAFQKLTTGGFDSLEVGGVLAPARQFTPLKGYNLDTYLPQPGRRSSQTYIGTVNYSPGGVTIQSITSYSRVKNFLTNDVPIYGYAFGGLLLGRQGTTLFYETDVNLKKLSQELRISSDNDSAKNGSGLQWQVGAFYTREKVLASGEYYTRDTITGADVLTPASPANALVIDADDQQTYREYAAYADATYFFSPQFDVELGGRIFKNRQKRTIIQGGALLGPPLGTLIGTFTGGETKGIFAVATRFHFNRDVMVYGRVASGYRPGGAQNVIPNPPPGLPQEFQADTTVNYEAGLKGTFLNGKLTADIAAFYVDWKDIQVNVNFPLNGIAYSIVANAGKAVSKGLEWNFNLAPTRGLNLGVIGAYTRAKLTRDAPGIGAFAGEQLPYVPKFSLTLTADYEWALSDTTTAYVGGSFSHIGKRSTNYALTPSISHIPFPGYETFDAQAGIRWGAYGLQIYGKNLTDKRGITSYYGGQAILGTTIPGQISIIRPREIGFRLTGNF